MGKILQPMKSSSTRAIYQFSGPDYEHSSKNGIIVVNHMEDKVEHIASRDDSIAISAKSVIWTHGD
jgi:hypothetical protein